MISAPENFAANVENENDVICCWDEISGTGFLGYYVYSERSTGFRTFNQLEWTDENVEGGTHNYYVTSVFDGANLFHQTCETVIILISTKTLLPSITMETST